MTAPSPASAGVLPLFCFNGRSTWMAGLHHGEERELFGDASEIETIVKANHGAHGHASLLMRAR